MAARIYHVTYEKDGERFSDWITAPSFAYIRHIFRQQNKLQLISAVVI